MKSNKAGILMISMILLVGVKSSSYMESFEHQIARLAQAEIEMCNQTTDCERNPFRVCVPCHPEDGCNDPLKQGQCIHKDLFPLYWLEIAGTFVLSMIMALCTMAGIGGGGVTVPLIQNLFQFSLKKAIALSGFSIFVCSVTRFIVNFKQKHPEKNTVSLDYGLATVMNPTVLMGSFIGVIFNTWFPDLVI